MVKVLFLGPEGTYSHQAALQQFSDEQLVPVDSIPSCFKTLIGDKDVDYCVVPLENSTNGQVVFTYDLFRDFMHTTMDPRLEVVGEQYVDIAHCLISPVPLTEEQLNSVCTIYSHPQVWGQVKEYLANFDAKYGKTAKIECSSTSGAVERCMKEYAEEGRITLAIASQACAGLHNASVVDSQINDVKGNTTRFLVLTRRTDDKKITNHALLKDVDEQRKRVNFVTFTINEDEPGSLIDVLTVLKEQQLNMCSISSRPFHNKPEAQRNWQYCFFIEFYDNATTDDELLTKRFSEHCARWIHWGKFYRHPSYYQIA